MTDARHRQGEGQARGGETTDKRTDAEAVAEAHGLDTLPEAIDYLTDDRSHGDELVAEIAARLARERWAGRPPEGNRKLAVEFIMECQEEKRAEGERRFRKDLKVVEENLKHFGGEKKTRHGRKT